MTIYKAIGKDKIQCQQKELLHFIHITKSIF